jgi:hypothetical protein
MRQWHGSDYYEKEFLKGFNAINPSLSGWQIWEYAISCMACSISNSIELDPKRRARREAEYERSLKAVGGNVDALARLMAIIVDALEAKPEEDFLGKMYMNLNMGNHWTGQFFTPQSVADCMALMSIPDAKAEIERKGYMSVCDPSCGAGINLLAAAKVFRQQGINYQQDVIFVGQDIDRVVAQMCYIPLALSGAAAYICVADTLINPCTGKTDLIPIEKPGQDIWYTPMYWTEIWQTRIFFQHMGLGSSLKKLPEKEHYFFTFDFRKENQDGNISYGKTAG